MRNRDMWQWLTLICLVICMDQGYAAGKAEFVGNVSGLVEIFQEAPNSSIEVTGNLIGLPSGQFELKLVRGGCGDDLEQIGGLERLQSEGEEEPVSVGVVKQEENVGNGLDSLENMSLVVDECVLVEGGSDCNVGERLGCAHINLDGGLEMEIIIIIIVAVIIFLLIVICIPVICCCVRKRSRKKIPAMEEDLDSLDDPFQLDGRSKSPMYDELSLPFIDASLPPTPRIGRTVNGLDILLGKNTGSTNSFDDK